jgi:hypothetical protein
MAQEMRFFGPSAPLRASFLSPQNDSPRFQQSKVISKKVYIKILDETAVIVNIVITLDIVVREVRKKKTLRMWRNWQTRRLQVPVGFGPWRFDSSHPH